MAAPSSVPFSPTGAAGPTAAAAASPAHPAGASQAGAGDTKLIHDANRAEEERASWLAGNLPNVVGWGQMEAAIARPGSGGMLPGAAPGVPPVLLIAGGWV